MNPLLDQFLSEGRDFLQSIGERLLQLEEAPGDSALMNELFRLVHTLKGNSGLFDLPEMTRVLHAAEDLMDAVRDGRIPFDRPLADCLLEAMDFVATLIDEIAEAPGDAPPSTAHHASDALRLGETLRSLLQDRARSADGADPAEEEPPAPPERPEAGASDARPSALDPIDLPEPLRADLIRRLEAGGSFCWLRYEPEEECFFKGEDPVHQMLQLGDPLWCRLESREDWPPLAELDAYRCLLRFEAILDTTPERLAEHFRYVPDQVRFEPLSQEILTAATAAEGGPASTSDRAFSAEAEWSFDLVLEAQREILALSDTPPWLDGRLRAVAASLSAAFASVGRESEIEGLEPALQAAIETRSPTPLFAWLAARHPQPHAGRATAPDDDTGGGSDRIAAAPAPGEPTSISSSDPEESIRFGRRAEDQLTSPRTLKVDQVKIDRLMNLIGEMVVAKNALPYLAGRAEEVFGVRELAREIKAQYGVINRIAEEMQDAIMQVRMMPVSFVFQRFPRLVRDIAHKLGKEVRLVMEGESTEADKNIIEALADPLVHIVRNSLDHGLETPEARQAAGKPREGRLSILARQESDRVLIEIADDGSGIDPDRIRRKAYERGLIDEAELERLTDQEAINLVFAAGFSTAEQVSDLSGRGVGMDVVRNAIARVNGSIDLRSQVGRGTTLRLSLPLSMAVTNVMIVESAGQRFGVPMDAVAETVRVARSDIRTIKRRRTTMLRGRLIPLLALNDLLALDAEQIANDDDELAVLVVRVDQEYLGIVVDDCRETIDIILKPLAGFLGGLTGYAGSALLGDGSVLLVFNPRELI
ncbi:chemotaxis protein CheA [Imhoffiella purpurea]|uniref:Chemotaxis protein CheA n=1 Tax=Imhoffiella purpurea TaxID=1249627 RepID=W9VAJ5_9GAMM|nr:chemotaxis protein CheA [Imhoffiella purpurea]EXJ13921.1 Signal transduction histidine kinase CheA [Imhoffiella purpurea]